MALHYAFHANHNSIYTTPLKALSNQKYAELRKTFGPENVGLSTGDMSINRGARIMVMTTEVYRNMAWRAMDDDSNDYEDDNYDDEDKIPTDGLSLRGKSELSNVKAVILDEFHYMGQKGRGGVWEECVITSPSHTQIIGLSATLPNAQDLALWMEQVTERKTTLVEASGGRPVPLRYLFATSDGIEHMFRNRDAGPGAPLGLLGLRGDGQLEKNQFKKKGKSKNKSVYMPLDEEQQLLADASYMPKGLQMNPKLKTQIQKRAEKINRIIAKKTIQPQNNNDRWGRDRLNGNGNDRDNRRIMSPREEKREREKLLKREMRKNVPSLHYLLRQLDRRDLLPGIFFIFSRAGCDEAADNVCYQMKKRGQLTKVAALDYEQGQYEGKQRKGRQRSARKKDAKFMRDQQGRQFRTNSDYMTETTIDSILDGMDAFDENENPFDASRLDDYAEHGLLTLSQVKSVASRIQAFNSENEEIAFDNNTIDRLLHGVGSHHAGQLPAHKAFVEALFRSQLMKAVFATETLAAGINMPARTTVICSLAKRGEGSSMNLLDTANLLQMAGRAGRRGMDSDGTCVLVSTPFEGPEEALGILTREILPVESQFSPGYALAVNLIARGEGKLDVAKKLVQKSFAMWNKQKMEEQVESAKELHGEDFKEVMENLAHEQFLDSLKNLLDKGRNNRLHEVLDDKTLLKKASKNFAGLYQILNLEESTLAYLQKEMEQISLSNDDSDVIGNEDLSDLLSEDGMNIEAEMDTQRKRIRKAREDVSNHIMTALAVEANTLMNSSSLGSEELRSALILSRKSAADIEPNSNVTPLELTKFAKSAVTMNRKRRKQKAATKMNEIDNSSLINHLNNPDDVDDNLDDLKALIGVLKSYGCIALTNDNGSDKSDDDDDVTKSSSYRITTAGENVGLLGLDNSLWVLAAMGGAWDVEGSSSELDKFKAELNNLGAYDENSLFDDDYDLFGPDVKDNEEEIKDTNKQEEKSSDENSVPLPQSEAAALVERLRDLEPCEMAGYVSSLVSDSSRGNGSVLSSFQQLSSPQQRAIQSSLLSLERLLEVQNKFSVDGFRPQLELATCEVVTAWTAGCTWNEALEISGSAPGDLVRTLHRALDALRQIGNLPVNAVRSMDDSAGIVQKESPGIHPDIRKLCRSAAIAMDRYPVKDPLPFEDEDQDEEDDEEEDEDDKAT